MRPKGKLFALLAVFMAIAVVAATGAFTTVSAERTVNVAVAGDSQALIALEAGPDNGEYIVNNSGQIEIDLSGPQSANGANLNATTTINGMLNITNKGAQTVGITINRSGPYASAVNFYNGSVGSTNITNGTNYATVSPGETIQVSMEIDTTGVSPSTGKALINSIEIYASANQ